MTYWTTIWMVRCKVKWCSLTSMTITSSLTFVLILISSVKRPYLLSTCTHPTTFFTYPSHVTNLSPQTFPSYYLSPQRSHQFSWTDSHSQSRTSSTTLSITALFHWWNWFIMFLRTGWSNFSLSSSIILFLVKVIL